MPLNASIRELEWNALLEICRLIGGALDLDHTLARVLTVLSEHLGMTRGTVVLYDEEAKRLVIRAAHGLSPAAQGRGVYAPGEGVTGQVFSRRVPVVVPDIRSEPLFLNRTRARNIGKDGVAFLGVPILLRGQPIGVMTADRMFGPEVSLQRDIEFLTVVAALVAQLVALNRSAEHERRRLERLNRAMRTELSERYQGFFLVARSRAMAEVQDLVRKVAPSRASVLLLGESGTGKTLIARILHEMSPRADGPFVKLNCAAIPDNLLEAELFGYERGAFTGAERVKPGRVEDADGGTLFLDEVGEMPMLLQAKLLRFLQDQEFERLGSTRTRKVDVRIVAATNRELAEAVAEGTFREDLFYRLNVFPIVVPPLRDRPADTPLLLDHFLAKFGAEYGKPLRLTGKARRALLEYRWPGNVREMENLMERLAILNDGDEIDIGHLPPHVVAAGLHEERSPEELPPLKEMERREVVAALERNGWVQSRAAKELGLTLRQIGYRIRKYGLLDRVRANRSRTTTPPH
ncbi:MAG: GAF domain-containing protein [Deltaproteobacteria bacterium]|nr:GAF domain-containing protein [Deltaproteobacteria bacterium]